MFGISLFLTPETGYTAFYINVNNRLLSSSTLQCVDVLQTVFFLITTTITLPLQVTVAGPVNKNILPPPFRPRQDRTATVTILDWWRVLGEALLNW